MGGLTGKKILMLLVNDVTFDQRIFRISSSLAAAGAELTVMGRLLENSTDVSWPHAKVFRYKLRPEKGPSMYLKMNMRFVKEASRLGPFDIVVSNDLDTLPAGYRISRKMNAKWVFDAHEHFIEVPELQGRTLKRNLWHGLGLLLIPKVDLAYTVGTHLKRLLSQTYRADFHVIPNYPKSSAVEEIQSAGSNIILYQGALNKGRGLYEAIEAMHQLEGMVLELAGEGDLSTALRQKVEAEQLQGRVRFLGRLTPEELRIKTPQAYIGLNLLDESSLNYYYSLANKYFDYAMAGIPSINMRFPEYEEFDSEGQYSILLAQLSPEAIVESIRSLRDDPDKHQQMCKAALSFAEAHQWSHIEPRLIALYEDL